MRSKFIVGLTLVVVVMLGTALTLWANVPAPPVNQRLGISDGVLNNLTEPQCRACHANPGQFPGIMPNLSIPDRHHVLTNPAPVGSGYACTMCHTVTYDPIQMIYVIGVTRNCLTSGCHYQAEGQASVHHLTTLAQNANCKVCHGTLVNNKGDGHYIPTYTPSIVTPYPSGGTGPVTNSRGNKSGACNFCHDSGTDASTGVNIAVYTNMDTHHNTGLGPPYTPNTSPICSWCHNFATTTSYKIRTCENCHGPSSLHNIQVSSATPPAPINPGKEKAGYGHIGADPDCKGCHGPQASAATAPYSGPTVVSVSSVSGDVIPAGQNVTLTIDGMGFVNLITDPITGGTITVSSKVLLTSSEGATTLLAPSSITADNIVVTIPSTTAVGGYTMNVVKVNGLDQAVQTSNPKPLIVVAPMTIASATSSGGVLTITGSGFGTMPTIEGTPLDSMGVTVNGAYCKVSSWTDTRIAAGCAVNNGDTVAVRTLFNGASASATVAAVNQAPTANAGPDKTTRVNRTVTFDGSLSSDADGTIAQYSWNLGNGVVKTGKIVTNTYRTKGVYTVTLTVTDDKGATGTDTAVVTVKSY